MTTRRRKPSIDSHGPDDPEAGDDAMRLTGTRDWSELGLPDISDLSARLRFAPHEGRIWLDDQRMILLHLSAWGSMRQEMIDTFGTEAARGLLVRAGYQGGARDANLARRVRAGESLYDAFSVGPQLHALEGIVLVEPVQLEMDPERGHFYGEFLWYGSIEADAHVAVYGMGAEPACWLQLGYASGYTSAFMGQPIVYQEVQCVAKGDPACRIIGKPVTEWEDDDLLVDYRAEDFVNRRPAEPAAPKLASLPNPETVGAVVGASSGFVSAAHKVKQAADTRVSVLFLGETGVGKERFARLLHEISGRDGPFVAVNSAAIPDELLEAELFGVVRGAYTGATESRPGKFERADGGTIFLDEVGLLSPGAQAKLLRVLQERTVERVGGASETPVDVRVVAATNEELTRAVAARRFRADLYYRLNVFPIRIPPLRERRDDIPHLVGHFFEKYKVTHGKDVVGFTQRALDWLLDYDFPGNVRELENMIERGVILAPAGHPIDVSHLLVPAEQVGSFLGVGPHGRLRRVAEDDAEPSELEQLVEHALENQVGVDEVERMLLDRAVKRAEGNISAAAKDLGLTRAQLAYRLKKRDA